MKRKTLAKELVYKGVGLHKGENIDMRLVPQTSGGLVFKRVDLEEGKNIINVHVDNTFDLTRGTNLKNEFGAAIYTVEHFLSALYILNITDLMIEIEGNELPIADGSAIEFVKAMEEAGVVDLAEDVNPIVVKEPVYVTVGDKHVVVLPYDGYKITYSIRFEHTFLKSQMAEFEIDLETYKKEIAPARTFGFDYEIEYLKKNGLALGGTLDNAIVVTKDGVLNPQGLRFEDEFVKHKILDIIGDLKVINRPIKGHIIAIKAGHAINAEIGKKLSQL
ncbi:MAG: UDP-3-O-[3-hydroxymyristoyl] N-acetylglucosamine deacetylase [Fusobacteriaceae bacterium]|nr:UDP-3-O-[3-hydroxymyristoyl] N-acetylglucosamine deacetylase [Fusobacteriaceae bacterium]MBP6322496.1 UDP-3-O-[3-hydroxymyristoyl] N-acetylglucosamine deacetylase [Fusobacteriaceae bacterium]MBP9510521.1 UDP-3-O-[3-hydroxymyristoyl] N-acetylglucosamine deacetylase [Fusobacteriaceae bacterium]